MSEERVAIRVCSDPELFVYGSLEATKKVQEAGDKADAYEQQRGDCLDAFRQIKNLLPSVTNRSDIAWICDRAIEELGEGG